MNQDGRIRNCFQNGSVRSFSGQFPWDITTLVKISRIKENRKSGNCFKVIQMMKKHLRKKIYYLSKNSEFVALEL